MGRGCIGALSVALCIGGACHAGIVRKVEKGQTAQVVEQVQSSRFEARGKRARAYADALIAEGQTQRARAVLLRDFRRGQQLASLEQLARLELEAGRGGMAALHFARLMALDARAVDGDEAVCELFRARSRAHLAQGEPIAADQDLRRVFETCGVPEAVGQRARDLDLARSIAPLARARASALRALAPIGVESARADAADQSRAHFARRLAEARQRGPATLADFASQVGAELAADDIRDILLDEFESPTRDRLYRDDEIAIWLGRSQRTAKLASLLSTASPPDAQAFEPASAWITLRLEAFVGAGDTEVFASGRRPVRSTLIDAALREPTRRESSTAPSSDDAADPAKLRAWKVFALDANYDAAELVLATWLKARLRDEVEPTDAASGEAEPTAEARPWWARLDDRAPQVRGGLLALARLRDAQGDDLLALRIRRHLAQRAESDAVADWARDELVRARPYAAWLLIREIDDARASEVMRSVDAMLEVADIVCGDRGVKTPEAAPSQGERASTCGFEADRRRAAAVLGRAAPSFERNALGPLPPRPNPRVGACPVLPVGLRTADGQPALEFGDLAAPETTAVFELAFETDLATGCAARRTVQLATASLHAPLLATLRERTIFAPIQRSSEALFTRSLLALATGHEEDAVRLARASAAESDAPYDRWVLAAAEGYALEARDYELAARAQAELHASGERARVQARARLRLRLLDVSRDELLRDGYAGAMGALRGHVEATLAGLPNARRAHALGQLRQELVWSQRELELEWDARALELLDAVLPPTAAPPRTTSSTLTGAAPRAFEEIDVDDPASELLAALVTGDALVRVTAARALLAQLEPMPSRRRALAEALERGGAAWEAGARTSVSWFASPEIVFRLRFGLPIDPALAGSTSESGSL